MIIFLHPTNDGLRLLTDTIEGWSHVPRVGDTLVGFARDGSDLRVVAVEWRQGVHEARVRLVVEVVP